MYDEELGLTEPMKINVYDTPGFDDANIDNIEKNRLLIATTLKYDIDAILYVTTDARFKETNQVALKMLNDWTYGQFWKNLIIVKGRTTFTKEKLEERKYGPFPAEMKDNSKIVEMIEKRMRANGPWLYGKVQNNQMVESQLTSNELENIKVSLINMYEMQYCSNKTLIEEIDQSDPSGNHSSIQSDCWRFPVINETTNQYEEDYDYDTFEDTIKLSEKFVFFEEAKELVNYLTQMKTHKIIPSARFHQGQLELDRTAFEYAENSIEKLDTDYRNSLKTPATVLEQIEKCDDIGGADGQCLGNYTYQCPTWAQWDEWASCKLECEQKGTVRLRKCFLNQKEAAEAKCVDDSNQQAAEFKLCYDTDVCPPNVEYKENIITKWNEQRVIQKDEYRHVTQTRYRGCLASSDYAAFCNGTKIEMSKLARNDFVKSYNFKKKQFDCQKVVEILRHDGHETIEFMKIFFDSKKFVQMTLNHIIYTQNGSGEFSPVPARNVREGDVIITTFGEKNVTSVQLLDVQPISPQVLNGIIVSNDVVVSTLTETDYHIAPKMIPLVDIVLDRFQPESTKLIFSKFVSKSRTFFQFCRRRDLPEFVKDEEIILKFVELCHEHHTLK